MSLSYQCTFFLICSEGLHPAMVRVGARVRARVKVKEVSVRDYIEDRHFHVSVFEFLYSSRGSDLRLESEIGLGLGLE
jgi:hypothetical protein